MIPEPIYGHLRVGGLLAAGILCGLVAGAASGPIGLSRSTEGSPDIVSSISDMPTTSRHPADVLRVFDGDTFEARVHVWPGLDVTTRVRLRGVDAPELKSRCGDEHAKAQAAREALTAVLAQGSVQIANIGPDKYNGRVVADASTRTTADVGRTLLDAGVVRPYAGGHRGGWC